MNGELSTRLSDIRERIARACARSGRAADSVRLIAVTKNHPAQTAQALIDLGVRDIGENRVQEIEAKAPLLRGDFVMHMIGHLQTNKARKVWPLAGWIQSVDRVGLIEKLDAVYDSYNNGGDRNNRNNSDNQDNCDNNNTCDRSVNQSVNRKKNVLVEVNTSGEDSKSGCAPDECLRMCEAVARSEALSLKGLMTIGPLYGDERAIRRAFALLRELSEKCCRPIIKTPELSMGMSGDFEWAIEEGATMVRLGTILVGGR